MSSGGRLILTNTSLSSLPVYTMGMFKLKEGIHQQMDSIRGNFFWQSTGDRSKYHMAKWEHLCIPKDMGGLGILNTRTMNEALLGKWVWRILKADKKDICVKLLGKKYLRSNSFLQCDFLNGSQFWRGVLETRSVVTRGLISKVFNGRNTRFWEDVWLGDIPLKLEYANLFEICDKPKCTVADCWAGDGWRIGFRRALGESELKEWERLMECLDDKQILEVDTEDVFFWAYEKSGIYSTRSMYRNIMFRGVNNHRMRKLWKSKLPMKIKVFMWLLIQDKLQTGVNLKKKKWKGDMNCCLCGKPENADHLFFNCILAKTVWTCFKEALGWNKIPQGLQEVFDEWIPLGSHNYHVKLFILSIVLWGIWNVRNKMCIEKVFVGSSKEIFLQIVGFHTEMAYSSKGGRCQVSGRHDGNNEDMAAGFLEAN